MQATTAEQIPVPTVYDGQKEELRGELNSLAEEERQQMDVITEANSSIATAQANLTRIQEGRRKILQKLIGGEPAAPQPFELTPEMTNEAINALRAEFDKTPEEQAQAGYVVQEGISFTAVETKLRAAENKAALASLYRMVQAGSRPAVVCEEGGRYCIAETFGQTPKERVNCVYDRNAEWQVGRENCNGNAVDQARAMGIPLMERRIANTHLTVFPDKAQHCYDYIQATEDELERVLAPYVCRDRGGAGVSVDYALHHRGCRGWRGALWV